MIYVAIFSLISNMAILSISAPLWDDCALSNLPFRELLEQFRLNGGLYTIITPIHYIMKIIGDYNIFFTRLVSLSFLVSWPILLYLYLITIKIQFNNAAIVAIYAASLPLFVSSFSLIVLPYVICLNLLLAAMIFLHKYINSESENIRFLLLALFMLFLAFATQSVIFFLIPLLIISFIQSKSKVYNIKKYRNVFIGILLSLLIFFLIKMLFGSPSGPYDGYNGVRIRALIFEAPILVLKTFLSLFVRFFEFYQIFAIKLENLLFVLLFGTLIFFTVGKNFESINSTKKSKLFFFIIGVLLVFSAIYPYAVVGKVDYDLISWSQRHNLFIPIGFSLMIFFAFDYLISSTLIKKLVFSFLIGLFIVSRIFIIAQFYHSFKLQEKFMVEYKAKLHQNKSTLYYINQTSTIDIFNWRFYEFGQLMRSNNLNENKLFFFKNSPDIPKNDLIHKTIFKESFIKYRYYGICNFDINEFDIKIINFKYNKEISITDFLKSVFLNDFSVHNIEISSN